MLIKSEFRKSLKRRIKLGCVLFIITLIYVLYTFLYSSPIQINPLLVLACMTLLFLIYASPDILKISKFTVTQNRLEKTLVITNQTQVIPFEMIHYIKKGKIRLYNRGGTHISDGFYFSTIILQNKTSFIISPDHFENYKELITAIRDRAGFED